jgi:hypothetical protein
MTATQLTKQQLIDAAVEIVQERAADALAGVEYASEYIEAHAVTARMQGSGLISHPDAESRDYNVREKARKSLEAKVKRLLDEEAAKPDARILRFSTTNDRLLPRLDGTRRDLYGMAVAYTTPELHQRAGQAVEDLQVRVRQEEDETEGMLRHAKDLGLPEPVSADRSGVTFDREGFQAILDRLAGKLP